MPEPSRPIASGRTEPRSDPLERPGELQIAHEHTQSGEILRLRGELDLGSAGLLEGHIAALCEGGAQTIVLEMDELTFMDSTGLRGLLVAQELCESHGCAMRLGALSMQVQRVLSLSGVGKRLEQRRAEPERG
jgi:anti-anti-sigma factor